MPKSDNPIQKTKKQLNNYARYSGMAFQMVGIILIAVFGGIKLDKWIGTGIPLFTVSFSILSVILSLYLLVKDFLKKKK